MNADALNIRIRPGAKLDVDALGVYGAQLVAIHHEWDPKRFISPGPGTAAAYASYLARQLERPEVIVLVAEDSSGEVVGYSYASLDGYDYMALRGPAGVIHDIFVDENSRRGGTGRKLLMATAAELERRGASQIVLSTAQQNVAGKRLFAAAGFKPTMVEMALQLKVGAPQ
jgi:ribosomal protein S18 acetylase RimI-like enzyme